MSAKTKPVQRRLPREKRRAEILRVATRAFHAKGYEATSFQDIAAEMGVKKAALYYYFSSKEDLLQTLLADILRAGIDNIKAIVALGGDPLTCLWGLVAGHIRHQCENLSATSVYLHERKWIVSTQREACLQEEATYQAAFVDAIRRGQSGGEIIPTIDPELAALSILGSTNWIYTWFRPGADLTPALIGSQFATMTINSLASDAARLTWTPPEVRDRRGRGAAIRHANPEHAHRSPVRT